MATQAQIIQLKPYQAQGHSSLITHLRGQLVRALVPAVQKLFNAADDVFFQMAERASNNIEQSDLFETMRTLRQQRKELERQFVQHAAYGLMHMGQRVEATPNDQELTLVGDDELEEAVAIDSMHARVLSELAVPFNALTARLSALSGQRLTPENNPLGAYALASAFAKALHSAAFVMAHKLELFKLFETHVLVEQEALFESANTLLISANVLPHLTPARATKNTQEPSAKTVQQAFSVIQELLSQQRDPVPTSGVPISEQDLLKLLSHLQAKPGADNGALNQKVKGWVAQIGQKTGTTRVVEQDNADVINLVSMLFEFILDDRTLPDALRALIARLQIPLLKVALLDKSFFTRTQHPARRLLNEIASAALGISSQADLALDNVYLAIEHVVQRVVTEFDQKLELFDELLAYFVDVTEAQARRSALLEQRLRDAELGRAKAEKAKSDVQAMLAGYLGQALAPELHGFIDQPWRAVMMLAHLKFGGESDVLRLRAAQLEHLVQSFSASGATLEWAELEEALEETGLEPLVRQQHIQALQHLKALPPATVNVGAPEPLKTPKPPAVLTPEPVKAPAIEVDETPVADQEAQLWAEHLRVGSWVEVCMDDGTKLRCKLAAMIKITGRYVFVNRNGQKVLEHTQNSLAALYAAQNIRLLDDALLFDRALESVIGTLRDLKQADA